MLNSTCSCLQNQVVRNNFFFNYSRMFNSGFKLWRNNPSYPKFSTACQSLVNKISSLLKQKYINEMKLNRRTQSVCTHNSLAIEELVIHSI